MHGKKLKLRDTVVVGFSLYPKFVICTSAFTQVPVFRFCCCCLRGYAIDIVSWRKVSVLSEFMIIKWVTEKIIQTILCICLLGTPSSFVRLVDWRRVLSGTEIEDEVLSWDRDPRKSESWWCRARLIAPKSQIKHDRAWSPHGWVTVSSVLLYARRDRKGTGKVPATWAQ